MNGSNQINVEEKIGELETRNYIETLVASWHAGFCAGIASTTQDWEEQQQEKELGEAAVIKS
jgi:hypothetical protein